MFSFKNDQLTKMLVIIGVSILLIFLIKTYYFDTNVNQPTLGHEGFYNYDESSPVEGSMETEETEEIETFESNMQAQQQQQQGQGQNMSGPQASEPMGMNENHRAVNESGDVSNLGQYMPQECYPKDVLSSKDLLPGGADSTWAQVVPAGQGSLTDQNFLTSGHHIGMNTVGNSLRNASHDLRSELPNPQAQVSPWNQTTIGPDLMRRPLDGC